MEIRHGITPKLLVLKIFNHRRMKRREGKSNDVGRKNGLSHAMLGERLINSDSSIGANELQQNDPFQGWVMPDSNEVISRHYVRVYEIMAATL